MSNYLKTTNFTAKDSLTSGDPAKKIVGSEFDTEFDALQTAIASKADLASPALTGIPTAPTASAGTSTAQLATTAFVQAALQAVYPVGSIYTSTVSTSPATLFGFGTWVEFGAGKVLVGQDTSDTSFDVLGETGGSKDAIVVSHTHTGTTDSAGVHDHASGANGTTAGYSSTKPLTSSAYNVGREALDGGPYDVRTGSAGAHTHTITTDSAGSSGTNANLQPYVVVKMWKRTA